MHAKKPLKFISPGTERGPNAEVIATAIADAAKLLTLAHRDVLEGTDPVGITASTDLGLGFIATLTIKKKCIICNLPMGEGICGKTKH